VLDEGFDAISEDPTRHTVFVQNNHYYPPSSPATSATVSAAAAAPHAPTHQPVASAPRRAPVDDIDADELEQLKRMKAAMLAH
jgi:hypothetical protein